MLIDLYHPQAPPIILMENCLDTGGFSCSAVPEQQNIVGFPALDKGLCVLDQLLLLPLITHQILKRYCLHASNGFHPGIAF